MRYFLKIIVKIAKFWYSAPVPRWPPAVGLCQ